MIVSPVNISDCTVALHLSDLMFYFGRGTVSYPVPITPDYGGPVVSFADGVYDARFNRYVTVMEGNHFLFIPLYI